MRTEEHQAILVSDSEANKRPRGVTAWLIAPNADGFISWTARHSASAVAAATEGSWQVPSSPH